MKQYLQLLREVLDYGEDRPDRTGIGVRSLFGKTMQFDLKLGFPILTTKRIAWKSVVSELLWFLEGSSDERRLAEILHGTRDNNKKTIWTDNANAGYWKNKAKFPGDCGKIYGVQWRNFNGVDQLTKLIEGIKNDPYGRRHILTAWNPGELDQMCLPPCHMFCQFYVNKMYELSCQMYQRSCDMFLGVPFNISSYSLLTHIIAKECNLNVNKFIWVGGDVHIYNNHFDGVCEQLLRHPKHLPQLKISDQKNLKTYIVDDFTLENYFPLSSIKAEMGV